MKSKIKFFADDTMIYSIIRDLVISASDLNHDLEKINKWVYQWKMAFNPEPNKKAVEVLFSQKTNSPNHPPLFFNGSTVSKANVHKHLGLNLDSKLSFVSHINEKINKAKKITGILKYLSQYLPLKTLTKCTRYLFVPISTTVMSSITFLISNPFESSITLNTLMERIEKIQYQAALAITGTWQGTSRNKLYDELGWESLSDGGGGALYSFLKFKIT